MVFGLVVNHDKSSIILSEGATSDKFEFVVACGFPEDMLPVHHDCGCMRNGVWYLPQPESVVVANIWRLIRDVKICRDERDQIRWFPGNHGKYSMRYGYQVLKLHNPKVDWARLVWKGGNFGRHSFILWLTLNSLNGECAIHHCVFSVWQAVDVTAPGGAPISNKGARSGGGRGGGYGGGGRRIGGGELSTCYNCRGVGHMSKDCPSAIID
ncbi:hypothetical protein ACFE04_020629 [Oxalis oulophora]